jgi:DNA primase
MAGRLPTQFIDELLARTDLVELIGARVPLKKAGRDYMACCPFHNEKTPSFTVSPVKQFYHCFGCGAHGSAISFLMEFGRLEFMDAVRELAERAGIELPETGGAPHEEYATLYAALEHAAAWYRQQLKQTPRAVDYLKGRGLSGEIAAEYGLGYAPAGWDGLVTALQTEGVAAEQMLAAGLVAARESGGHYDRFRERIMFPIRDRRGRVIGFGGRVIEGDGPKYLNSPETPLFHKGRSLYGLYEAKSRDARPERLLVVEGYMDVVALAQHGLTETVATLGTATTREHVELLQRNTDNITFCFDGDRAGRAAAWRALESALPVLRPECALRFLFLPEGEDPDSLIRKEGRAHFEARLSGAATLSDYLFETLTQGAELDSAEGRARLAKQATPLLARLPQGVFRDLLQARLAALVQLPSENLSKLIEDKPPARAVRSTRKAQSQPASRGGLIRKTIQMLLQRPALARLAGDFQTLIALDRPGVALLIEMLEILHEYPELGSAALIERWRDRPEAEHLARLAVEPSLLEEDALEGEFRGALERLAKEAEAERQEQLYRKGWAALDPAERERLKRH